MERFAAYIPIFFWLHGVVVYTFTQQLKDPETQIPLGLCKERHLV